MKFMEPQNARSRRTREALLGAARTLVEEQGFEAMTLAAVAELAGVSHRALYLHFPSRADLLSALYRQLGSTEDLAVSLRKVWDSPDAVSAIEEWCRHLARAHPRIIAISRAVERARLTDADAAVMWEETLSRWHAGSRKLVSWLADEGRLASGWNVGTAADMMWALMSWDVIERLMIDEGWPEEKFAEHFILLTRNAFVSPPAGPRP